MRLRDAVVLGAVQGVTEFLPVSSSAHVSLVGRLLGRGDPGAAFTAVTQLGTEAAVLVHVRDDVRRIVRRWWQAQLGRRPQSDPDVRLGWSVLVGSLPIGVLGATGASAVTGPLRNLWVTSAMLIAFAGVMDAAERRSAGTRTMHDLDLAGALGFGMAQALALIPGVSRSGGTIAGGLLLGYRLEDATRFSFLLAIPAVLASGLHQLLDIASDEDAPDWPRIGAATAVAFVTGRRVVAWMLDGVATRGLRPFALYRVGVGALLAGALATGAIPPR